MGYEEFTSKLDGAVPGYYLVDHDYKTTDGRDADKIVLISWWVGRAASAMHQT